jgi:hypothetical protein
VPKKKSQRNSRAVIQVPAKSVKPWVRWSAIIVIFALVFSIMLAAMTSAPASAVSPSASPTVCTPIDTDGDGIQNNNDSDIDGDGLVNGMDEDIDGDGVANGEDNDATSTNCEQSTTPPTLNEEFNIDGTKKSPEFAWQWVVGILAIGFGYLTLRQVRRRK